MEINIINTDYKINISDSNKDYLDRILIFYRGKKDFDLIALKGESAGYFNEDIKEHIYDLNYHLDFLKYGVYVIDLSEMDDNEKFKVEQSRSFNIDIDKF